MRTYMSMYQNEERAAEIIIRDQDDKAFIPSGAFAKILDSKDNIVRQEEGCLIVDNKIYTLVNDAVTNIPGKYTILWRIMKTAGDYDYKYFHKTEVNVEEL